MEGELLVLYDRDCSFCSNTAKRWKRLDAHDLLVFQPFQEADLGSLGLNESQCLAKMHTVGPGTEVAAGWSAVVEVMRRLPRYRIIVPLIGAAVFRPVGRAIYGFIASRRKRALSCEESCDLHW